MTGGNVEKWSGYDVSAATETEVNIMISLGKHVLAVTIPK